MGANKNSLEENRLSPKITHKDSNTNLPRSHSHSCTTDPRSKTQKAKKQSGSKHRKRRTKKRLPDPYRIIRNQPPDHPGANRTVPCHSTLTSGSSYRQQCYTRSPVPNLRIIRDSPENSQRNNPNLSINGSPKPLGVLILNVGEMMSTPKGRYGTKILSTSSLQLPESQIMAKNTMN
jgi:hypothetical protein